MHYYVLNIFKYSTIISYKDKILSLCSNKTKMNYSKNDFPQNIVQQSYNMYYKDDGGMGHSGASSVTFVPCRFHQSQHEVKTTLV